MNDIADRSPNNMNMTGNSARNTRTHDDLSVASSRVADYENLNASEIISDHREKIQKLQLKSANYSQRENTLKRDNDYLKKQLSKLKMTVEKLEEHREQDAESLLAQEQKLSNLKGKYRASENPNETAKTKKNLVKLTKEENEVLKEVKTNLDTVTGIHRDLADIVPQLYEQLRKLKFYGDKQMNEILLRQINIYVEQLNDKAKEYEKQKQAKFEENKALRQKLKEKYQIHEQLKTDCIEDYKQWFGLQRKLNFYETDFMIEREEQEKA